MIPGTRLRPSSILGQYHFRRVFAKRYTIRSYPHRSDLSFILAKSGNIRRSMRRCARQIGRCYFADGYFAEDKPNSTSDVCDGSRMGPFSLSAYRPLTSPDLLGVRVASLKKMAGTTRLELATSAVTGQPG